VTSFGGEQQLHRGPVVGEPRDDLGAPAFLDEGALEVAGAHPDAVPGWDAVDGEHRVQVVLEAADRRRVLAPMSVDQPVGARAASSVTWPNALEAATTGSTTCTSSRYSWPSGIMRFSVPQSGASHQERRPTHTTW
jgi:hypothetical protein